MRGFFYVSSVHREAMTSLLKSRPHPGHSLCSWGELLPGINLGKPRIVVMRGFFYVSSVHREAMTSLLKSRPHPGRSLCSWGELLPGINLGKPRIVVIRGFFYGETHLVLCVGLFRSGRKRPGWSLDRDRAFTGKRPTEPFLIRLTPM